jgi:hypothetical protein
MAKKKTKNNLPLLFLIVFVGLAIGLTVYMVSQAKSIDNRSRAAKAILAPSTITMDQRTDNLTVGSELTFKTQVYGLKGWEYPMIAIACYQDVNEDGEVDTNLLGPDIVFTWLDRPNATFTLGGYSSIWTLRGGGPATCKASLMAYGWHGGVQSTRTLAEVPQFDTK